MAAAEDEDREGVLAELDDWVEPLLRALGLAWVILLIVELVWGLGPILATASTAIWIVFIIDFAVRLAVAQDRSRYLRTHWLVAVSILVPALRFLRFLRVARAAHLARAARASSSVRVVRVVSSINRAMNALRTTLVRRRFGFVVLTTVIVIFAGAAGMLALERDAAQATLRDYPHALWWTAMLITTIGSEVWPKTAGGMVLCFLLSLYGLAMFGYIAATLASHFLGRDAQASTERRGEAVHFEAVERELRALRQQIETLTRARGGSA